MMLARADDVRRQQHHDVGLADRVVVGREELLENRHVDGAREPGQRLALVLAQQAGQQVRLAVAKAQARGDRALAERRHADAGHRDGGAERAVVEQQVEDDVAVDRHPRASCRCSRRHPGRCTSSAGSHRRRRSRAACSSSG